MNGARVHDRVHGEILLPPAVVALCNTRSFFRLDGIRQLGGCSHVYPSATHSRREHSIGVSHLAGKLVQSLREQAPHLIDADDVTCAQIAGLLHDLGHGPFSHLFEDFAREHDHGWDHEVMGVRLFRRMLDAVDVLLRMPRGAPRELCRVADRVCRRTRVARVIGRPMQKCQVSSRRGPTSEVGSTSTSWTTSPATRWPFSEVWTSASTG